MEGRPPPVRLSARGRPAAGVVRWPSRNGHYVLTISASPLRCGICRCSSWRTPVPGVIRVWRNHGRQRRPFRNRNYVRTISASPLRCGICRRSARRMRACTLRGGRPSVSSKRPSCTAGYGVDGCRASSPLCVAVAGSVRPAARSRIRLDRLVFPSGPPRPRVAGEPDGACPLCANLDKERHSRLDSGSRSRVQASL